jgi:Mrp family chromosome partitioning ATPase
LVVEADGVTTEIARRTTELLNRAHAHLLGAVLNKRQGPVAALPQTEF